MSIKTGLEYVGYINPWTDEECLSDEEIVRCRDCKYCHPRPWYKEQMWCGLSGIDMTKTDGFCSWGKRRVDE